MKKSLWLLLVVAALIAVFAVAGCLQGTTPEEPTEPEEPTTPTPTDYCPTTTTTTLQKIYNSSEYTDTDGIAYKLYIQFDQPVFIQDLACYTDPANWTVTVSRYVPFKYYDSTSGPGAWKSAVYKTTLSSNGNIDTGTARITVESVSFGTDSKTLTVTFTIDDPGTPALTGYTPIAGAGDSDDTGNYYGLICSEADYNAFIGEFDDDGNVAATDGSHYADVVSWSFDGTNVCGVVYDAQGNACVDLCELSGSLCCEVTYCEECVEVPNCPIGEGTCL